MRYVILGLGNIGSKRRALLGERCIATVDPYNPAADFRDISECSVEQYDAAVLAVPNKFKLDLLRLFLQMGKYVLIEKPLLLPDRKTAENLHRLAKETKAVWYTSYNHRFEPLIEELKMEFESGRIGEVYYGRLLYGNGTVGNIIGSWREEGLGVLEDLGPHLLDLVGYLFGCIGIAVEPWSLQRHEAKSYDHCILATADHRFVMEMSFLSWKNNFEIELYGEKGSVHLKGLTKWGSSGLTVYERARPSGVPRERRKFLEGPDVTWERDLAYFERFVGTGETSMENDWWISKILQEVAKSV